MKIMVINVLAIGDTANVMKSLSKITKKSKIHIVNFPKDGAGIFIHDDNVDRFLSWKVKEQVEYINKIKNNFDICIVMGAGERIAYLADLNYIAYYVGRDIDAPRFIKNSKEFWFKTPLHKLNFLERKFYYNTFKNAVAHVSGVWVYPFLEKHTANGIKMDMQTIDNELFKNINYEINMQKTKFTFFSPQRMGIPKGTDLLWKALKLCKTDFEILQVNWFDESNDEELKIKEKLLNELPSQVKLIPMIQRKKMPEYYSFADAIIGNMRIGTWELVDLEGVMCGKPVLSYSDLNHKLLIKGIILNQHFYLIQINLKILQKLLMKLFHQKNLEMNFLKMKENLYLIQQIKNGYQIGGMNCLKHFLKNMEKFTKILLVFQSK